jgi:hypothetical protein
MPIKLDKKPTGKVPDVPVALPEILAMRKYYKDGLPPKSKDAISAWVSRAEIEALLKDNEVNNIVPNGIRIYYGRHVESTLPSVGVEYKDKHNVILVATFDTNTVPKTETSVDLLEQGSATEDANSVSYSSSYKGMGDDTIPLCPPRCPQ